MHVLFMEPSGATHTAEYTQGEARAVFGAQFFALAEGQVIQYGKLRAVNMFMAAYNLLNSQHITAYVREK